MQTRSSRIAKFQAIFNIKDTPAAKPNSKSKQRYNKEYSRGLRHRRLNKTIQSSHSSNQNTPSNHTSSNTITESQPKETLPATISEVINLKENPRQATDTLTVLVAADTNQETLFDSDAKHETVTAMDLSEYMEEDTSIKSSPIKTSNETPTPPLTIVSYTTTTTAEMLSNTVSNLRALVEKDKNITHENNASNSHTSRSRSPSNERNKKTSLIHSHSFPSTSSISDICDLRDILDTPDDTDTELDPITPDDTDTELDPEKPKHCHINYFVNQPNPAEDANLLPNPSTPQASTTPEPTQSTSTSTFKSFLNNHDHINIQNIVTAASNSASSNSGVYLTPPSATNSATRYITFEIPIIAAANAPACPLASRGCHCSENSYCPFTASTAKVSNWSRSTLNMSVDTLLANVLPHEVLMKTIVQDYFASYAATNTPP